MDASKTSHVNFINLARYLCKHDTSNLQTWYVEFEDLTGVVNG